MELDERKLRIYKWLIDNGFKSINDIPIEYKNEIDKQDKETIG